MSCPPRLPLPMMALSALAAAVQRPQRIALLTGDAFDDTVLEIPDPLPFAISAARGTIIMTQRYFVWDGATFQPHTVDVKVWTARGYATADETMTPTGPGIIWRAFRTTDPALSGRLDNPHGIFSLGYSGFLNEEVAADGSYRRFTPPLGYTTINPEVDKTTLETSGSILWTRLR